MGEGISLATDFAMGTKNGQASNRLTIAVPGSYQMSSKPISAERSRKNPMTFIKPFVIAGMLITCWGPLHAMDIYRWVDDVGETHMSDRVPEKYKAVATRIDSKKFDITDADRMQANESATRNKLLAESKPADAVAEPAVLNAPKPVDPTPQSTCSQKWDAYYSSQECFAPFRVLTPSGSKIRPEGFHQCQIVESPVKTCDYDKRLSR
jgi:hypothetical protein